MNIQDFQEVFRLLVLVLVSSPLKPDMPVRVSVIIPHVLSMFVDWDKVLVVRVPNVVHFGLFLRGAHSFLRPIPIHVDQL